MPLIPRHVRALLAALQLRGADTAGLRSLDDSEWRELLPFCDRAHLTFPLLLEHRDILPPWVRERLEVNASDNSKRFERIKDVYREAAGAFAESQVEHLVAKGFAQNPGYVEEPRLRMQSDIDIYCPADSLLRARDRLLALGYEPQNGFEKSPSDHLPTMTRNRGWQWRGNVYDPEMPPSIELHFSLWNKAMLRFGPDDMEAFWKRRVTRHLGDFSFTGLDPVDNFGFSALHGLRDVVAGDGGVLHRIYEMARFLHTNAQNDLFWAQWGKLHSDSLRASQAILFRFAKDWFACDMAEPVEEEVRKLSPAVQQWFHRFHRSPLEWMFRPNKDGLWLHMALLESWRDKSAVLRPALMPTHMPAVGAPGQERTWQGTTRKFWPSHRYARHVVYVSSRVGYHAQALAPALSKGARWWLATKFMGSPRIEISPAIERQTAE